MTIRRRLGEERRKKHAYIWNSILISVKYEFIVALKKLMSIFVENHLYGENILCFPFTENIEKRYT